MGIKENIERYLEDDGIKKLFEKIYREFKEEGKGGIKKILEEEVRKIKEEFEIIKRNIEKQIGG